MADVIVETHDKYTYSGHHRVRILVIGLILGLSAFVLTSLLGSLVVDPLLCRGGSLDGCSNSLVLAGNIAAIIVTIAGTLMLARLRVRRAIWIALSALTALWSLVLVADGLGMLETALWITALYGLSYFTFATIFRLRSMIVALAIAVITIVIFRWIAFV